MAFAASTARFGRVAAGAGLGSVARVLLEARRFAVRCVLACLALLLAACASSEPPQVELAGAIVHDLPSQATGRPYQLFVSLPASYGDSDASFPVVFLTDANLWFPVVRNLGGLHSQRGQNIEEYILVGLTHEVGVSSAASRARDYTPSDPRVRSNPADPGDYQSDVYGEAEVYRDYIETEVFPFVAANYRADMSRTVYLGHSYGGLFGAFVLSTKPQMFQTYLLSSPSFWFDSKVMFEIAQRDMPPDVSARVMMTAGGYETIRPEPRYYKTVDIVADLKSFATVLETRSGLTVVTTILPDEDHFTVFPSLITRGLLWALPGRGPYMSG